MPATVGYPNPLPNLSMPRPAASDNGRMQPGEEWVYRLRDSAPSERVRVLAIHPKKTGSRVDVEFLDDNGRKENVPGARLRRPWSEVAAYDVLMANWQRIDFDLTEVEDAAACEVFDNLIPAEIATYEWSPVRYATGIHDRARLEELLGMELAELLDGVPSFEHNEVLMVSPEGTLRIAEALCEKRPADVLAWVMKEEEEIREKCKRGRRIQRSSGPGETTTSPEWEYEWYLKSDKPRHELLRQWCGHRAISFHERLAAAEAEVRRLDILVARLIDDVRARGGDFFADFMEEEHNKERITPEKVRPVVERPLSPHEIPVREVPVRRRWGH